ncbi:pre-mRNA-processing factor 39-2-like [Bidens hawaiensis]|uniref:pre-mRNA-processing factor 39-2-like n=1 Tax=Bidens hawaiensis TaxID=980011 RepID=UPI0040490D54
MDLLILANAADDVSAMETVPEIGSPEDAYEVVAGDSLDFDSWTALISEIEKTYPDNIKAVSSVYESFLSWFPLCHGYWKKYADHMARLCNVEKAVEVYEQAVQSATYSVALWVDYCSFSIHAFADPFDVRRIFERGLSFVGKDFLCHKLWDLYIRFELSQQQWSVLAHLLIRALKFPTKSLHKYYDNFKELAAFVEEDMSFSKSFNLEPYVADSYIEAAASNDEIYNAIKELQDSSSVDLRSKALKKLNVIAELYYYKSCRLHEQIDYFENYMERDLFNVKPLDDEDLQNWHNYLDFIEKQEDFVWAVKVYERCLIPCANYPEFWMRYVEFMESNGGRELANFALERATQVFLKNVSEVHIFNARFREKIGDIEGARAAFNLCDTESDSSFVDTAIYEANMEARLGNKNAALGIYDKALKIAAKKQKISTIPILYIHFFRLKFLITGSADDAFDLLISGIQQVPFSRLLIEELINFAMLHEGSKHLDAVDHIVDTALTSGSDSSQGLSSKDREDLSNLYLKFVDYCGTTHDIRKAWNHHIKHFPRLIRSTFLQKYPSSHLSNDPKKPRKKTPRIVAKQPSRVHSTRREEHKSLTSKSQPIDLNKPAAYQNREMDDIISEKENTHFQQSDDNAAGELEGLSQKDDQDPVPATEKDQEQEDTMNPTAANQNPVPATESAKKQNKTDEHEHDEHEHDREPKTGPQQIASQNIETSIINHMLTTPEHVPNVQQPQNPASASQLHMLTQNSQPMVQYPVQSSEQQPGVIQNPQTYNQMWQYQYQNQQQWMQMQQYIQQQRQQQFQTQPQTQHQYHQFYQQQEQYQQYWLQVYQQQQQMQEYNMQMQQYQQIQQLPKDLHQNHLQQIPVVSNLMRNISHDQQSQGMMPPNTTMPYTQLNLSNAAVQPMAASTTAPTNIVTPSNQQPPSDSI